MIKLESQSERWPGYIGVPDVFTYPQVIRIQDMIDKVGEVGEKDNATAQRLRNASLPFLFEFVEEWGIEGIENDPDKFPGQPLEEADAFLDWWFTELMSRFDKEEPKNE